MKVGDNMEIYKGSYSDKKYQFIYNIEDIKEIVKPIFNEYKVNHVLLFGSYARNEASLISDIDLCIINPRIKSLKLFSLKGDLQKALSKDIDIFQISSIETDSPIYNNIFSEGIQYMILNIIINLLFIQVKEMNWYGY